MWQCCMAYIRSVLTQVVLNTASALMNKSHRKVLISFPDKVGGVGGRGGGIHDL